MKGYTVIMAYDPDYQRGRSGRPMNRVREQIKREGGHICWLCGKPIDMGLDRTHPMSWTVDHVQPLSLYPELALDMGNMREAHRRCNSARGQGNRGNKGKISRNW